MMARWMLVALVIGVIWNDAHAAEDEKINGAVASVARTHGKTMAQIALAWVMQKQPVAAPIVGVTKLEQLTDALGALDVKLGANDVAALEAPYRPRTPAGFQSGLPASR